MRAANIRCVVVETRRSRSATGRHCGQQSRDLLPWADPYIAQLMVKHQLQQAAARHDDSYARRPAPYNRFLTSELPPPLEQLPGPLDDPIRRQDWPGGDPA